MPRLFFYPNLILIQYQSELQGRRGVSVCLAACAQSIRLAYFSGVGDWEITRQLTPNIIFTENYGHRSKPVIE